MLTRQSNPEAVAIGERLLESPEFPDHMRYLWEWYLMLRMGLGVTMDGLAPLSWTSLDAWVRLTGSELEPRETEALFYLDIAYRNPGEAE